MLDHSNILISYVMFLKENEFESMQNTNAKDDLSLFMYSIKILDTKKEKTRRKKELTYVKDMLRLDISDEEDTLAITCEGKTLVIQY